MTLKNEKEARGTKNENGSNIKKEKTMVILPIVIFIISGGCCDDSTSNFSNVRTAG